MTEPLAISRGSIALMVARMNEGLPAGQAFRPVPIAWADACATALDAVRAQAELTTPRRLRQFMAQIAHETGGFRSLVESVSYSDAERLAKLFSNVQTVEHARRLIKEGPRAIACCIYANKLGNGGIESGDGYRFRGRGFLMNTGRANYKEVQRYASLDTVDDPDLLGRPGTAAQAAAAFWKLHHLNAAADEDATDEVTRVVNGPGMQGKARRRAWAFAAGAVWPDLAPHGGAGA